MGKAQGKAMPTPPVKLTRSKSLASFEWLWKAPRYSAKRSERRISGGNRTRAKGCPSPFFKERR